MELPVVPAAEGHCELITDFETDCSRLSKPQVMGIAGLPPATPTMLTRLSGKCSNQEKTRSLQQDDRRQLRFAIGSMCSIRWLPMV
jgi:hypothetical protein